MPLVPVDPDLEVVAGEIADRPPAIVEHADIHRGHVDGRAEARRIRLLRSSLDRGGGDERERKRGDGDWLLHLNGVARYPCRART